MPARALLRPVRPDPGRAQPHLVKSGARLPRSEQRLVRRAGAGSRRAFERLWSRHAPAAHAVLLSMVPPCEADDLMQDVALAAWNAMAALSNAESFAAWLCAIARNRGRNALARRRRGAAVPLEHANEPAVACRAAERAEAEEILDHLRALPPCYREPLTLRLVSGLSGPEIAAHTGMTAGSVRVNLHRGMKLLRQRLEGMECTR